ncbi:Uncharacterized protein BM_BM7729 [Brugia malayi]|nr:Uncharacterized protein BM_BM7729 [Brugia malayi]VIO87268.1 Uncharacterized protein BM_BM7729 [Brugia malayi]
MCGRVEKEEEGYQYTVVGKPVAYQESSREDLCFENSKFVSKVNFTGREELPPINDMLEAFAAFAMTPHRLVLSSALDLQASCINEQAVNEI